MVAAAQVANRLVGSGNLLISGFDCVLSYKRIKESDSLFKSGFVATCFTSPKVRDDPNVWRHVAIRTAFFQSLCHFERGKNVLLFAGGIKEEKNTEI